MEAFNEALLAKQFWRLLKDHNSLVAHILGARYYPDGNIFNTMLRTMVNFAWCSIMGVKDVIIRGFCWLTKDGSLLNIWNTWWLPRPTSFKPINPRKQLYNNL